MLGGSSEHGVPRGVAACSGIMMRGSQPGSAKEQSDAATESPHAAGDADRARLRQGSLDRYDPGRVRGAARYRRDHRGTADRAGQLKELVLAIDWRRPLHVVVIVDENRGEERIVTVYEPDPERWRQDVRKRRR
jgi:hypothetical protein